MADYPDSLRYIVENFMAQIALNTGGNWAGGSATLLAQIAEAVGASVTPSTGTQKLLPNDLIKQFVAVPETVSSDFRVDTLTSDQSTLNVVANENGTVTLTYTPQYGYNPNASIQKAFAEVAAGSWVEIKLDVAQNGAYYVRFIIPPVTRGTQIAIDTVTGIVNCTVMIPFTELTQIVSLGLMTQAEADRFYLCTANSSWSWIYMQYDLSAFNHRIQAVYLYTVPQVLQSALVVHDPIAYAKLCEIQQCICGAYGYGGSGVGVQWL